MTLSKVGPKRPAPKSDFVRSAPKKVEARPTGYAGQSSFEGARGSGRLAPAGGALRRDTVGDLKDIKSGLRSGNDAAVRLSVSTAAARLGVKLPDLSGKTGWASFSELGGALGVSLNDPLNANPLDFRAVRKALMTKARINDPDPSNGKVL